MEKQCPLFLIVTMAAYLLLDREDLNPFSERVRGATKCLGKYCGWFVAIRDGDKYAAGCSCSWLGHQAILDAMLDRKVPNAEEPSRVSGKPPR